GSAARRSWHSRGRTCRSRFPTSCGRAAQRTESVWESGRSNETPAWRKLQVHDENILQFAADLGFVHYKHGRVHLLDRGDTCIEMKRVMNWSLQACLLPTRLRHSTVT